jgi:hypothetical protein
MDEDDLLGANYAHEQDLRWQLQRGLRNQGEGYKGRRVEGAGNRGLVQGDHEIERFNPGRSWGNRFEANRTQYH